MMRAISLGPGTGAVSYTHLDVYKRQVLYSGNKTTDNNEVTNKVTLFRQQLITDNS